MNSYKKITFSVSLMLTLVCSGGYLKAESLQDAVMSAIHDHPTLKASQSAEMAAKQDIIQRQSDYMPRASVGASFGRIFADNTTTRGLSVVRGAGYSWYGEGTGNVTQMLYDWSQTKNSVESAKAKFGATEAQYMGDQQGIAGQAAQAYIQLLRADFLLKLAKTHDAEMSEYSNRIQASFDNGGADESQVSRARNFVALSKNMMVQYEGDYRIAQAYYKESLGRLPEGDLVIPSPDLDLIPATIDDAVALAVSLNSQIKSAEMQEQSSFYDKEREESNLLPKLNAELSYNRRDQADLVGGESKDARALVRANWDYAFGGAQMAAQKRAAMVTQEASFRRDAVQRMVERDVNVTWVNLNLVRNQMKNNADRFKASDNTLMTYLKQYEGGQKTLLDLMEATSSKYSAQMDYVNSIYQEMGTVYSLMSIMGIPFYNEQDTIGHVASGGTQ